MQDALVDIGILESTHVFIRRFLDEAVRSRDKFNVSPETLGLKAEDLKIQTEDQTISLTLV